MNSPKFIIQKKPLLKLLAQLKATTKRRIKYARSLYVDISLTTDDLTLTIPGIQLSMEITGNGAGKASMSFLHFYEVIMGLKKNSFILQLMENEVRIGETIVQAETWLYQDDSILRKINLPVNYGILELLRLPMIGYTWDELSFNKLTYEVILAEDRLEKDISAVARILRPYGIKRKELDAWIKDRVYMVAQDA